MHRKDVPQQLFSSTWWHLQSHCQAFIPKNTSFIFPKKVLLYMLLDHSVYKHADFFLRPFYYWVWVFFLLLFVFLYLNFIIITLFYILKYISTVLGYPKRCIITMINDWYYYYYYFNITLRSQHVWQYLFFLIKLRFKFCFIVIATTWAYWRGK